MGALSRYGPGPAPVNRDRRPVRRPCTTVLPTMTDALISFVSVADLDRSDHFYRHTLGLTLVTDQTVCRVYRASASGYIGVCAQDRPITPGGLILTLVRDDVEAYCAHLASTGVAFEQPPRHNERFGITHAFLRDPDGYLVEIQRFDDPHWSEPVAD